MPIKNYTTSIDSTKTFSEIQHILAKNGANSAGGFYREGKPIHVSFSFSIGDSVFNYRIQPNVDGVLNTMIEDGLAKKYLNEDHAVNVAWRITKDWIDAQMAIVRAGAASIPEVFMPYTIDSKGLTMFEVFSKTYQLNGGGDLKELVERL